LTKKSNSKGKLSTVLDLIGAKVQVGQRRVTQDRRTITITEVANSPFTNTPLTMNTYLPKLLQNLTTSTAKTTPGRVNINQAPRLVLKALPGMTDEIVDEIISRRHENPVDDEESRNHEGWILSEGVVTLAQMKKLLPLVTVAGSVHRAQIVGYYEGRGPVARLEALFDATTKPARVLFWRDISHLGRGYAQETLGSTER